MTAPIKASLRTEQNKEIPFLYNPADLTIAKANTWQSPESKGRNAPELTFQAGQSGTLTFSITLDTTADGTDVSVHANQLLDLLKVDQSLAASDPKTNKARPPWVEFRWGKLQSFK